MMYSRKEKVKRKRWKWLVIFILIIGFIGYSFIPGYLKIKKHSLEMANLEKRIEELRVENRALKEKIDKLKNDPVYIESLAREKLGMVRPGEMIYRIKEEGEN